jgi:hypothetical protein
MNTSLLSMRTLRGLLLIALALVGSAVVAPAQADATAPEQVIRDFYRWYVGQLVAEKDPFKDGRTEMKRYATERLIAQINKMRNSADGVSSDYFLNAQDFDKDWAKNLTISTPVVKNDKATANVELKGAEMGTQKLRVTLAQEKGTWKVDKVDGL